MSDLDLLPLVATLVLLLTLVTLFAAVIISAARDRVTCERVSHNYLRDCRLQRDADERAGRSS